jgi:hypothetical protein
MTAARLRVGLWIGAQIRLCARAGVPLAVLRRGDPDAGSVILKVVGPDGRAAVLSQATSADGRLAWHRPLGREPVAEGEAEDYIARQARFDPDIWALEIMDRQGIYVPDGVVMEDD